MHAGDEMVEMIADGRQESKEQAGMKTISRGQEEEHAGMTQQAWGTALGAAIPMHLSGRCRPRPPPHPAAGAAPPGQPCKQRPACALASAWLGTPCCEEQWGEQRML